MATRTQRDRMGTLPEFIPADSTGTSKHGGSNVTRDNKPVGTRDENVAPSTNKPAYKTAIEEAIGGYKGASFGYNPYQIEAGPELQAMNFNPYRQNALNDAASNSAYGYSAGLSGMERSGGLTGADRLQAIRDFNRQKVMGQLGAGGKYDALQSRAQFDADKFNRDRQLNVMSQNVAAQNEAARDLARANLRRSENLYAGQREEERLSKQISKATEIAHRQSRG